MPSAHAASSASLLDLERVEDPARLVRFGTLLIAVLVLGIGVWMALAPLSGAVIAPGFIKVDMNRKTVQHQEGGIVSEILVRDGSRVKAGQKLLVLRDVRVDASQDLLTTQLDSEIAKAARLRAEELLAPKVTFPRELAERSGEQRVAELLARETALFEARMNALSEQTSLIRKQAQETAREIEARSRQLAADERAARLQKDELDANAALLDKGFVSKTRLFALQRSLSEYEARLGENHADLAQARQRVVELELKATSLRNNFAQQAAGELKETTAQVFDLQEKLRPSVDASVRQNVTAPIAGEVVDLKVTTVGAVIGPRDPILEILPENPDLIIEARIRTEDINYVRHGADADVRLIAFKQRITPVVEGKVVYVSADRLVDKASSTPAPPYYAVHIRVAPEALQKAGDLKLQAGMPAEVFIKSTSRTTLQYLFDPVTAYMRRSMREP
jgi:HlyD family type I secretion membrane fusion protein